jgi:hypothetical protein
LENNYPLTPGQLACIRSFVPEFAASTWEVELAGQAASARSFVRIREKTGTRSFILVIWDAGDEDWKRFVDMPSELVNHVPFLPAIYATDPRHGCILEEDFGDMTLARYVVKCRDDKAALEAGYQQVLNALCQWQSLDAGVSPTIASRSMDRNTFLWETDYFARRYAVDFCGCEHLLDARWEAEREILARKTASLPATFLHRDFQSENILIVDGNVRFVDFQGARMGPPAYDLASLLCDPYVDSLTREVSHRLFDYYQAKKPGSIDRHVFDLCAAQRLMQALGAYGNLSIHKGKTRYRQFIPLAQERLCRIFDRLAEFPAMRRVVAGCAEAIRA